MENQSARPEYAENERIETERPSSFTFKVEKRQDQDPPTTKKLNTDSEEDPEYDKEEFDRLRNSLHRKIDEAEKRDRELSSRNSKIPCIKIRRFFRRIFNENNSTEETLKAESTLSDDLDKLKSSSQNRYVRVGGPFSSSSDSTVDEHKFEN